MDGVNVQKRGLEVGPSRSKYNEPLEWVNEMNR